MIAKMLEKRKAIQRTFNYIEKARALGVPVRNHGNDYEFKNEVDLKTQAFDFYQNKNGFKEETFEY